MQVDGFKVQGCGSGFAASIYEAMPESDIATIYTPRRFLKMSVVTLLLSPSLGRGMGYSSRFSLLSLEGGGA